MKTNSKPAFIYTRGVQSGSEENQRLLLEKWASNSGYHVLANSSDTRSGTSTISRRPGRQQLLEALQSDRSIHDVIVYDSRLSRRASDAALAIQDLSDMNVKVHYAVQGVGPTGDMG